MVASSRIEGGTTQFISISVRRIIKSIKEIVGDHSDADIYAALKETNMDPNETTQKLLNQDPFHEVKRKRDKKKEVTGYKGSISVEPRKSAEQVGQGVKFNTYSDRNAYSDRNVRRGGYSRNAVPGVTREFRVVRDNRNTQSGDREMKPLSAPSNASTNDPLNANVSQKSNSSGTSNNQKPPAGRQSSQHLNGPTDSRVRQSKETASSDTNRNNTSTEKRPFVSNVTPSGKQNDSLNNNSVVGVYSSSSDPVHVPSLDPRQAANVGAIKREVGAVGARRQPSDKMTSGQTSSSSKEISRSFTAISKSDQPAQTSVAESAVPVMPVSKPFLNNQHNNRSHQQVASHQKAPQPNKEWKPKSSQKPSTAGPGVIGTPAKSSPSLGTPNSKDLSAEAAQLLDKLSRTNIHENQNVIIAPHIRVSETDRCRLTFGSLGKEGESSTGFQTNDSAESNIEPSASVSLSPPESSSDEASVNKKVESLDERVQSSGSISPPSGGSTEQHQSAHRKESPRQQTLENYADIGLVRDNTPSYTPDLQQQQDPRELQNFAAYDSQGSYDIPYFRSAVDESVRGQILSIPHEVLVSHANAIPSSTISMVQQQQAPMAQMYPPVHVSHYALPYRQFISPMYVPPIAAMPGYSNNPAAYSPHPSNGSSYLLMPGANSPHLNANGLKYGIQQFKPIPTGGPTGFGNFTSPTGYAINAPGVVGSAAGLDDSSRLKYKDANLYVPNPQGETSELWMNPRDIPSMQSAASYYNMTGQQAPHAAAYMQSHASFNAAAAAAQQQSSHMQFQGMYHPQAQTSNPHHMGGGGGNVGVGVAPGGGPGGAYQQQPQLGHMNWSANF